MTYFTSSKYVKELIDKYGKDSFDAKIILEDKDYDKCHLYEQELIDYHLGEELCLNKFCVLTGKFSVAGVPSPKKGKAVSNETITKMRLAQSGKVLTEKTKSKMSDSHKGKSLAEETKIKIGTSKKGKLSPRKGVILSEETKIKMSKSHLEKAASRLKMSESHIGKPTPRLTCPHCNKMGGYGPMIRWHFENCKEVTSLQFCII